MYKVEDVGNPKNYALHSELCLWASVLELAIHDFLHGDKEERHEALTWIFEPPVVRFNSFENICLVLDLEPDAVKERLKHLSPEAYRKYRSYYRMNRMIP